MSNADNSERRSNATVCAPPKSLISHTSPEHSPKSWVWSKHMSIGFRLALARNSATEWRRRMKRRCQKSP